MQFETPTTKAQMYDILKEIFYYYRIRKDDYEEFILPELTLERMTFTPKTEEEIKEIAKTILLSKQTREKEDYVSELLKEKSLKEGQRDNIVKQKDNAVNTCINECEKSIREIRKEAQKKGLGESSVISGKILELELYKNAKIQEITDNASKEYDALTVEIEKLNGDIQDVNAKFLDVFTAEINAKVLELLDEQEERRKEVFKYNNTIEEKCQRYKGTVATTNATLRLRYLDINTEFFSKEQLVEMGYYEDVVKCVTSYFDTLSVVDAYREITAEEKLVIYLDDYYQNLVYMYRTRAGI